MEERLFHQNHWLSDSSAQSQPPSSPLKEGNNQLMRFIQAKEHDYDLLLHESLMESSVELELKEQELSLLRRSIDECRAKRHAEEERLHSIERVLEERCAKLRQKGEQVACIQRQLSSYIREIEAKEIEIGAIRTDIEERSREFEAKTEQLKSVQKQIGECERELRLKQEDCNWQHEMLYQVMKERDEVHRRMRGEIEDYEKDFGAKKARLGLIQSMIREREKELKNKDLLLDQVLGEIESVRERKEAELREILKRIVECNYENQRKEEELGAMQKLIDGEARDVEFKRTNLLNSVREKMNQLVHELEANRKDFDSFRMMMKERSLEIEKQFEGRRKELESKEKQFEGRQKDIESREKQYERRVNEIRLKEKQLESQVSKLESKEKQFEGQVKEHEAKEIKFEAGVTEFKSKEKQIMERMKELESKEKLHEWREKKLESNEKQYEGRVHELKSKVKQVEVYTKQLESKEKQLERLVKDLETKMIQYERQVKDLELKETHIKAQLETLELKEKHFEGQVKDLESKYNQFKERAKDLESTENQHEGQMKELQLKEGRVKEQLKELELKEKLYEEQMKELESNEKRYEEWVWKLKSKEKQFEAHVKELESNEKQFERQVKDLEFEKKQYEEHMNELELKEVQIKIQLKELESKEKQYERRVKKLDSKQKQLEEQQKELELKVRQYESLKKSFAKEKVLKEKTNILPHRREIKQLYSKDAHHCEAPQAPANVEKVSGIQLIPSTDGTDLLLNKQTNGPELIGSDNLVNLQKSSDPAKLVLDTILNTIAPHNKNGDKRVIIDVKHVLLLEQLMRISPHVKPHVRDEAMKLALDLKANMRAMTENSLVVLGFLLFLSIYGLVSSFDEDEVLKLFQFAAKHKQAVELFHALGFVDKASDFVQNLVKNQQHIEAVRFICAYKLSDKIHPVDPLREHMQKAKLISKNSCNRIESIAQEIKAKDAEITSLGSVLQCISDNKLESPELVKEIQDHILELERQKLNIAQSDSDPSFKNEVQQCDEKEHANEADTKNQVQVQQSEDKNHANEAVMKNQVITINQVEVKQPREENHTNEAVIRSSQDIEPEPNFKKCANEAITTYQVKVEQYEEKKRGNEAVNDNYQLQHWADNNKRPRTVPCPVPPSFTPLYYQHQHAFRPLPPRGEPRPAGVVPQQFGFPHNYYGPVNPVGVGQLRNSGPNYFYHPWPCPPGPYPRPL